jgi:hypothetical protein
VLRPESEREDIAQQGRPEHRSGPAAPTAAPIVPACAVEIAAPTIPGVVIAEAVAIEAAMVEIIQAAEVLGRELVMGELVVG